MDAAVEMAKCREAAFELTNNYAPAFLSCAHRDVFVERAATALLGARADALRESDLPYLAEFGPGETYRLAEELMVEVRARRARGL